MVSNPEFPMSDETVAAPATFVVDEAAAKKAAQSAKMKAWHAERKAKEAKQGVALASEVPHPMVEAAIAETRPLMDPVQFLMVFFSTNPGLIQALEAYPNKTAAAEGLYINAYKAYLEIAAPGRSAALWDLFTKTQSALTGK
jgi:alpha-ketoglutarate-dependent taurine dioxygenase